jgi:hypothetical protein
MSWSCPQRARFGDLTAPNRRPRQLTATSDSVVRLVVAVLVKAGAGAGGAHTYCAGPAPVRAERIRPNTVCERLPNSSGGAGSHCDAPEQEAARQRPIQRGLTCPDRGLRARRRSSPGTEPDTRPMRTGQSPGRHSSHRRRVHFTLRPAAAIDPDGVSRTAVHRLSTGTLCSSPIHPSQTGKRPGRRLRSSMSSQKPHLRPTHDDAETTSARFETIPRSTVIRNPRSEP